MEKWISEKKAKELFSIDAETLLKLEEAGKIRTIFIMGNKKLYLMSSLETIPKTTTEQKSLISKFFSWFKFKKD